MQAEAQWRPGDFGLGEWQALALSPQPDGSLWLGTMQGLLGVSAQGAPFRPAPAETLGQQPVSAFCAIGDEVWIGGHQGLFRWQDGRLQAVRHQPERATSLSNNRISVLEADGAGVLLVGTYFGGLNLYNPYAHQIAWIGAADDEARRLPSPVVRAVAATPEGGLWIGSAGGLSYLPPGRAEMRHYGKADGLSSLVLRALCLDASGTLWAGTGGDDGRLHFFDEARRRFLPVSEAAGYPNAPPPGRDIYAIRQTRDGTLWVGTQGAGLYALPPGARAFRQYAHDPKDAASLANDYVNALQEDVAGNLWVGTRGGLCRWDRHAGTFRNYRQGDGPRDLPNDYVKCLLLVQDQQLWVGTAGTGMAVMLDTAGTFETFSTQEGLPNGMIYGMVPDGQGHIWASTNQGIFEFDPARRQVLRALGLKDGLQADEFNTGAYAAGPEGEVLFGGVNGLNAFRPAQLKPHPVPARPWLQGIRIMNQPVGIEPAGPLPLHIGFLPELVLRHDQKVISFEVAALHYAAPEGNKIAYRLRGLDEDWQVQEASRRFVTFTTLPPNEYVLEIKAGNADGVWGEETRRLSIVVRPPWWATWWFRLLAAGGLLATAYAAYRWRVRQIKAQKRELVRLVQERTAVLEEQKAQLNTQKEEILVQNEELRQQQDEILAQRDFIEEKSRLLQMANEDLEYSNQQVMLQKEMLEASLRNLEHLSKIGREITATLQVDDIIRTVYEHVNMLMDASSFGIGLHDEHHDSIEFHGFIERGVELPPFRNALQPDRYLSAHCFSFRKEIILLQRVGKEAAKYVTQPLEVHDGSTPNSVIYLPLLIEGRAIGVITVQSLFEKAYSDYEINMLRNIAVYTAIALDNANAYNLIRQHNRNIRDSIEYARNIQQAILPEASYIRTMAADCAILYEPKDIVSGDLYWFSQPDRLGCYAFALMDCTGHGVPGAFMSLIGHTLLSDIVATVGLHAPEALLPTLEAALREALKQEQTGNADGMDIALCVVAPLEGGYKRLSFAGAKQSCYYACPGDTALRQFKGTRRSLGGKTYDLPAQQQEFELFEAEVPEGTVVYLFTDGVIDQNGRTQRRYGTKRLLASIEACLHLPLARQMEEIAAPYNAYRQLAEQRDDISLLLVKL
jgi:serine phosphatase RsbU (regulator of sigma subunit)/streptogramin lyase